jgi:hypothetical protein
MTVKDDIRKTLTDPTPLYFAAGVIDKIRAEAPERLSAAELKKLREQAQTLAMQGLELANEYAAKARVTYGELADRGRGAVRTWRGAGSGQPPYITVERDNGETTGTTGGATSAEQPGDKGDQA